MNKISSSLSIRVKLVDKFHEMTYIDDSKHVWKGHVCQGEEKCAINVDHIAWIRVVLAEINHSQ